MAQKRVLFLCGDYVEDAEVIVPFQALQAYGVSVDAVCPGKKDGDTCPTSIHQVRIGPELRGHDFTLNATFDDIKAKNYDGLVIPGGRSPENLAHIATAVELVSEFAASGKPIAAICHGPLVLAAAGAIKGRKVTGFPAIAPVLVAAGAHWVEPESIASTIAVADGNIITAVTFKGHSEFIRHFVKALGGTISGSPKKILFLCGDYMEDYEATVPFQSFEALGCRVDSVCPKKKAGETCVTTFRDVEGGHSFSDKTGYDFVLNANFDDVNVSSYDALVIPGGRAPAYMALNHSVLALVNHFMQNNKPVASISQGQKILAAASALKGRKCTAHPTAKLNVVLSGGTWVEPEPIDRCVTDGNLVTGASWSSHPELISQFMAMLHVRVSF
ncbi:protein DJ-1 homolog D-like [Neltuma alba]|uniref:protein DJ-1 homolog D-like n=1 Tax=Neltuma alba TaxID=207710 RepID=UPI0010A46178|nr:protein DJ-1 homolog D-like [Prosopis alba]